MKLIDFLTFTSITGLVAIVFAVITCKVVKALVRANTPTGLDNNLEDNSN